MGANQFHAACVMVLVSLLAACGSPAAPAPTLAFTATPTTAATPTPVPPTPTATPTHTPIPAVTPTLAPTAAPTQARRLATSAKDIVGTWLGLGADGMYQRFNKDGTCQTAVSLQYLATLPQVECTFRFEGTRFILTEVKNNGLPPCSSKSGTYEVELLANGRIKFVKIQDACKPRANSTALEHEPVR